MDESIIYLAVTRGRNRLVITGSFELYGEFMRSSLPAIQTNVGNKPAPALSSEPAPLAGDMEKLAGKTK